MLTIITNKRTPGQRHRINKINYRFISLNILNFFLKKKKNSMPRKKALTQNWCLRFSKLKKINIPTVFLNYVMLGGRFKEFGLFKDVYGGMYLNNVTGSYYPGFKFYSLEYILNFLSFKDLIGHIIPLNLVPLNLHTCYVYDVKNSKPTYACSFGSNAIRKKDLKKTKIISIELPSGVLKYFNYSTLSMFSSNFFFKKNKLIEGSWGFSLKTSKKIVVRGVAKNPVDHPNGGRTKTNKPERSPWGWVAKRGK